MPTIRRAAAILAVFMNVPADLPAEIPLPDATLYGTITTPEGSPVTSGALRALVRRGAAVVLESPGVFKEAGGTFWYAVSIPMETNIGAPGPTGAGAHEGDALEALVLDGSTLELNGRVESLKAGSVTPIDATTTVDPSAIRYDRGDCNADRSVDITDAVGVLFYLFMGLAAPPCLEACDSEGSGAIDLTDAVYILLYLFLGQAAPPAPSGSCGVDPSPSALGCAQSPCPGGV